MIKPDSNRLIWGILFFAWSCLIILFSALPDDGLVKLGSENSDFRWDYLEHLSVFTLFSFLLLQWRNADPVRKRIYLLFISGILFASLTELSQLFIESRSFNYVDLLFNFAGLPLGIVFIQLFHKIFPRSST